MKKTMKWIVASVCLLAFVYMGSIVTDKKQLSENILRLHVVANSDSQQDQAVKLLVRDAVLEVVDDITAKASTKEEARTMVEVKLYELENTANAVLDAQGIQDRAKVTLGRETFPVRKYDTFTLPAGVYDSLRITIGEGEGRNWWCVVFPGLCLRAASDAVADAAAGAGFSDSLSGAITEQPQYEIRFYFLDLLGRLENFFHKP